MLLTTNAPAKTLKIGKKREETRNKSIVMLSKNKRHSHQRNGQKKYERCRNTTCDGKTYQKDSAVHRRTELDLDLDYTC